MSTATEDTVEETTTENQEEGSSYLAMSDEDIMKMMAPAEPKASAPVANETPAATETEVKEETSEPADGAEAAAPASGEGGEDGEEVKKEEKPEPEVEAKKEETGIDYEAEYRRLLAPFKANGKDISVASVDDAIALMQMGANYNKKMAGLKPHLKVLKLLENNGLMSEEKLSFLIELDKKSPEAINKLVKDSGLNPMDFDAEKAGEYKPKIHSVDDREIALDTVLDEISHTPTYNRTLDVVANAWDGASKQIIADTPQLLKVINDHMASGIFDRINTEMERERMFGRLNGLSDLEAYRKIGDAIQARGGFNDLVAQPPVAKASPSIVVPPKVKPADDKLNDKRRAASSTKAVSPAPSLPKDFNPLALSDEEFAKLAATRF